jgi:hypothetical protein
MKDPVRPTARRLAAGPCTGAARGFARGVRGTWDRIAGPGAGAVENAGSLGLGLAGAVLAPALARPAAHGRAAVLRLLAVDLWGGAWCNNTPAAARWYHRDGQGAAPHLVFSAGHVHPVVLAWLDGGAQRHRLRWALALYGYLLAATAVVTAAGDRRVRRTLGLATTVGGVLLDRGLGPSAGAPWFAPVFFAKLLAGHAAGAALLPVDPLAVRPRPQGTVRGSNP